MGCSPALLESAHWIRPKPCGRSTATWLRWQRRNHTPAQRQGPRSENTKTIKVYERIKNTSAGAWHFEQKEVRNSPAQTFWQCPVSSLIFEWIHCIAVGFGELGGIYSPSELWWDSSQSLTFGPPSRLKLEDKMTEALALLPYNISHWNLILCLKF